MLLGRNKNCVHENIFQINTVIFAQNPDSIIDIIGIKWIIINQEAIELLENILHKVCGNSISLNKYCVASCIDFNL